MDKFSFITLWDTYNGLLTATRQEITDLYFNKDLTVSEIAEEKGISRQAVSDCLKGCKKQLEEYEEKLHICRRLGEASFEISALLTDAGMWAEALLSARPDLAETVKGLTDILERDYSADAKKALENPAYCADYTALVYGRSKTGEE